MSTIPRLKITLKTILDPQFFPALDRLGEDPIQPKERYAIARTRKDCISHAETFEEERIKLIKKMGKPEIDLWTAKLAKLKATPDANATMISNVEKRLQQLALAPKSWGIDNDDPAVVEQFNTDLAALRAVEVEVYLDHQVILNEASKLTSSDMACIMELIALPPDAPALEVLPDAEKK